MTAQQKPHYVHRIQYSTQERLAGAFVLTALLVLVALAVTKGQSTNLFQERITYHARLNNAQGVSTETQVKVSGIKVGRVSSLEISDENRINVTFFVYERFQDLIRSDSRGSLGKLSMLGNATLSISAGSPNNPHLEEGASIPVEEPKSIDQIMAEVSPVVESLKRTIQDVTAIVAAVEPAHIRRASKDLAATAANARAVSEQVASGRGAVGEVLYGETTEQRLQRTTRALARSAGQAERQLARLAPIIADAQSTMAAVTRVSERLPMLGDRADELLEGLNTATASANQRLERLPKLTSSLDALLGEANRTVEGLQRLWPISKALSSSPQPVVIEAQPSHE